MVLFRVYYLGLALYDKARHFVGWSERSWVNWTGEIRRHCGTELLRRGMFPRRYFTMAAYSAPAFLSTLLSMTDAIEE
jgi:hypothetical protein